MVQNQVHIAVSCMMWFMLTSDQLIEITALTGNGLGLSACSDKENHHSLV